MASIFTKIIEGEIPSYKIYEDDKTYAFLNINPETKGHTLVVPKVEVDKIYELADEDYTALWASVKKVAQHMEEVTGRRVVMKVIGTDVPHAHVHLMPIDDTWEYGRTLKLRDDEFEEIRKKIAF
ncbi:MAG: HIT domain-containing protein [Candidatus Saccharibacteria bacterium]|nr:HIT domain-containing protein [Candidatus Saccharibacteria bacterium]